jgi:transcriptional regulator with XRE-family HTH domain
MTTVLNALEFPVMVDQKKYFKDLGERLALLRKEAGVTQAQLGQRVGLSQQMIADYESGTRQHIPLCRLLSIAEALDMDVDDLLKHSGGYTSRKPGPASKLNRLTEQITKLPRSRQQFVVGMIEDAIARAQ